MMNAKQKGAAPVPPKSAQARKKALRAAEKKASRVSRRHARMGYLFTLPWLIGFLAFTVYPLIYSMYLSMHHVSITASGIQTTFTGFQNYIYGLTMDLPFLMAIYEQVQSIAILTPLILILSLILGMLLSRPIRGKGFFRALYFFPVIIVSGPLMSMLETNGVFSIVELTESGVLRWMGQMDLGAFLGIVLFLIERIFTVLWFSGVQILIYLSGIQKISGSIYEAAYMDGASGWQVFWKITLPSMNQFTIINVVYTVVMLGTFSTNPVLALIKKNMFISDPTKGYGYSTAMSWMYFLVVVVVLVIALAIVGLRPKRREKQ